MRSLRLFDFRYSDRAYSNYLKKKLLESETEHADYADDWVGAKLLGAGAYGHAGLWVKIDPATHAVVDRIVIKECVLGSEFRYRHHWHDADNRPYEIPIEAHHAYLMTHDPSNIVELKAHAVDTDKLKYRLYMEYCALGDLHELMTPYCDPENDRGHVPEPFLWKLFEDLVKAVITMENPNPNEFEEAGNYLVHTDMKPENVFLQPPDAVKWPKYPIAKVGDFGGTFVSNRTDAQNKAKAAGGACTAGFIPPETWWPQHRETYVRVWENEASIVLEHPSLLERVSIAANIWSIGCIMATIMRRQYPKRVADDMWFGPRAWHQQTEHLPYSKDLNELIQRCLNFRPQDRPTPSHLLTLLRFFRTSHTGGMHDERCLDPTHPSTDELLPDKIKIREHKFFIGEIRPPGPPPVLVSQESDPGAPRRGRTDPPRTVPEEGAGETTAEPPADVTGMDTKAPHLESLMRGVTIGSGRRRTHSTLRSRITDVARHAEPIMVVSDRSSRRPPPAMGPRFSEPPKHKAAKKARRHRRFFAKGKKFFKKLFK